MSEDKFKIFVCNSLAIQYMHVNIPSDFRGTRTVFSQHKNPFPCNEEAY
jgi:hypothetical protein